MKAIVFIGTNKSGSSREAIKAAEQLGYYTILITERISQMKQRKEYPDVHQMIHCDLNEIDTIKKKIKQVTLKSIEIVAIVSFTEPYCYLASLLADEFGVGKLTTNAILKMQNKILSREAIKDSPYVPWFKIIHEEYKEDELKQLVPFIMKNPSSTGSKDVYLIKSYDEFVEKFQNIRSKNNNHPILIEEYLDGPQFIVEAVVIDHQVHMVAVIAQEINQYNGHYIVTGYSLVTKIKEQEVTKLQNAVNDIVRLHGLENGPCHLELRLVKNEWKLIEINPRISGGAMNELLEIGLGINLVRETLKFILGKEVNLIPKYRKPTFADYSVSDKSGHLIKITGRNQALRSTGVKKVFVKPRKGALITPPVSLGNRYAFVIATGRTSKAAREHAKNAVAKIHFHLELNENKSE